MTAEFVLHFKSAEEFLRVVKLLKESGVQYFTLQPKFQENKPPKPEKQDWAFGIGNLGGRLDQVNIRDYAYEN
ncbi:MAG: hypothetical protein AAB316_18325 [Bacteroidota bacterium]